MNNIIITGRLTADPELRRTGDGTGVCSYSLAVKRPKVKDTTDFINCVSWRQGGEYLAQYGHNGDLVAASGSLQGRKWTDKEGKERTAWEVVTDNVELLSSKKEQAPQAEKTAFKPPVQFHTGGYNGYSAPQQPAQQRYQQFGMLDDPDVKLPF